MLVLTKLRINKLHLLTNRIFRAQLTLFWNIAINWPICLILSKNNFLSYVKLINIPIESIPGAHHRTKIKNEIISKISYLNNCKLEIILVAIGRLLVLGVYVDSFNVLFFIIFFCVLLKNYGQIMNIK